MINPISKLRINGGRNMEPLHILKWSFGYSRRFPLARLFPPTCLFRTRLQEMALPIMVDSVRSSRLSTLQSFKSVQHNIVPRLCLFAVLEHQQSATGMNPNPASKSLSPQFATAF